MSKLPREIVLMIYQNCCCKPTPEEAQKEPCACVAAAIVDAVEDWVDELVQEREEARAKLRAIVEPLKRWREGGGLINLDKLAAALDAAEEDSDV